MEHDRGDQPGGRRRRLHGRELRLAMLRGELAPERLRRRQPEPLRGPVLQRRRYRSVPRLLALGQGHERGALPGGNVLGVGHGVQPAREHLARRVRRSAVLRRLRARLHLGDAALRWRAAEPLRNQVVPHRGVDAGGPPVRPRRRSLLRGRLGRKDQADRLHGGQSAAPPCAPRHADDRRRAAVRAVRRARVHRPRQRSAHLRLGPGRRRPVRRLRQRRPGMDLQPAGHLPGGPPGHRLTRRERHRQRRDHRGQHTAGGHDHDAHPGTDMEGRRPDQLQRRRHRPPGRHPRPRPPGLVAAAEPLPVGLPQPRARELPGREQRQLRDPGPRISVPPRAPAHGHGRRRADRHTQRPVGSAHR